MFMHIVIAAFHACNSAYSSVQYVRMHRLGTLDHTPRSRAAKPNKWPWEDCEDIYKQSHLQKRAMSSVYYGHGGGMDHFTLALATY